MNYTSYVRFLGLVICSMLILIPPTSFQRRCSAPTIYLGGMPGEYACLQSAAMNWKSRHLMMMLEWGRTTLRFFVRVTSMATRLPSKTHAFACFGKGVLTRLGWLPFIKLQGSLSLA